MSVSCNSSETASERRTVGDLLVLRGTGGSASTPGEPSVRVPSRPGRFQRTESADRPRRPADRAGWAAHAAWRVPSRCWRCRRQLTGRPGPSWGRAATGDGRWRSTSTNEVVTENEQAVRDVPNKGADQRRCGRGATHFQPRLRPARPAAIWPGPYSAAR